MTTGRMRVASYTARDGSTKDVEIAYDVFGTRGKPLVLIMGIGAQRIFWDNAMCEQFVDAGFQVVRFDHRDIGHSTKLDAKVPPPMKTLIRGMAKVSVDAPYDLSDMAHDVIQLIKGLGWQDAHMVGVSMGGMIGQHLAMEHGDRVRSLTTIMTTPGGRRYMPEPYALRALFAPAPKNAEEAGLHVDKLFSLIGSKAWPHDGERLRAIGMEAHARGMNPRGFLRHFAAVMASGDRREKLRDVKVPTLVIHGSKDPMFPLSAGRKIAQLTHGTWLPIAGMGHDMPEPLWPTIVAAIRRHAERADSRATK
ncbi:MAG TPA: alpha/beta hydrolase [Kofleriaceae bacterium]|nr:alpha/beta hydrolase [Kofleriaceae bacterium]